VGGAKTAPAINRLIIKLKINHPALPADRERGEALNQLGAVKARH
jgi:hypothetical protein